MRWVANHAAIVRITSIEPFGEGTVWRTSKFSQLDSSGGPPSEFQHARPEGRDQLRSYGDRTDDQHRLRRTSSASETATGATARSHLIDCNLQLLPLHRAFCSSNAAVSCCSTKAEVPLISFQSSHRAGKNCYSSTSWHGQGVTDSLGRLSSSYDGHQSTAFLDFVGTIGCSPYAHSLGVLFCTRTHLQHLVQNKLRDSSPIQFSWTLPDAGDMAGRSPVSQTHPAPPMQSIHRFEAIHCPLALSTPAIQHQYPMNLGVAILGPLFQFTLSLIYKAQTPPTTPLRPAEAAGC